MTSGAGSKEGTESAARRKRLLGLALAGAVLVSGALWARRRWDPHRFDRLPSARLEAWVAEHPDDADALYALGRRYRQEGQVADARQALERAQRLEPGNARVLNDLGELHAARGDYAGAQLLFEQAAQLRPDLPQPHRNLGNLAGIARNYVLAIQQYRQALVLAPHDVPTLTALGSACADALNRGEAEAAFREATALAPNSAEVTKQEGLALFKLRDYAAARAALERAVELAPPDAHTHLFLGLVNAQQPRGPEDEQAALDHFDQATRLGYAGGEDDYGRGLVFMRRKQYPKAIAALETAVRLDAGAEDARYQLGRAYTAAGHTARGQVLLQQFQRMKQTEPEVKRLRFQLATRPTDTALRRRFARLCGETGRNREALQQFGILKGLGAADAAALHGMLHAAVALGDARAAAEARAALRGLPGSGGPPRLP